MKFSFFILLLGGLASAQNICMQKLRIGSYKFANPNLGGTLEVKNSYAYFDSTSSTSPQGTPTAGFPAYVYPSPRGSLYTPTINGNAYLSPVTGTSGLYDLRWGNVPSNLQALSKLWWATGCGCGGNCGGICFLIDDTPSDDFTTGQWVAKKADATFPGNGYVVRWYNGTVALGSGYQSVLLWREPWVYDV